MKTKSIYGILVAVSFLFAANVFGQTNNGERIKSDNQTRLQTKEQLKDGTGDLAKDQIKTQLKDQAKDGTCIADETAEQSNIVASDAATTGLGEQLKTQTKSQLKDGTGEQLRTQTKERANLTVSSKDAVGVQNVINVQNRNEFKASLTNEQKELLQNKTMTKAEKQEAFMKSLSQAQVTMLKTQYKNNSGGTETVLQAKEQTKYQLKNQTKDCDGAAINCQQEQLRQAQQQVGSGNKGGQRGNK